MSLPFRKIVVPLDGSVLAEQALPHAETVAQQAQAELVLFRVVPYITEEIVSVDALPLDWQSLEVEQQRMVNDATNYLQEIALRLSTQGMQVHTVVEVGHAADRIVDYATAHDVDLIVMCTHGRTGVQRWLMGSVAGKVTGSAPCPVLLVRARH
ncbi:MAG: universal stress protein [Chloroflexi bacterium]|nr:MAG: universal stress protein [Chloroflexota bacterium]